ncbi:MAG: hypothetical protein DCF22_00290 [Leptolyngbya sp.]|nr:MAG: hypothetical protein DCF22_00290 [Leptolyngbya sp.]
MVEPVAVVLKTVSAIAAGAISLGSLTSKPAQAVTLTYDMTVDVTQGNYQGTYQGSFSYDNSNPLQPCQDSAAFTCATVKQNKLSILFNFLGKTYSEKQDLDYELGFPAVYFQNNALVGLSFVVIPPTSAISFSILGESFYMGFETYPDTLTKQGLVGTISYKLKQLPPGPAPGPAPGSVPPCPGNCESIPEPSEIAGSALAIALLGLALKLRRKE